MKNVWAALGQSFFHRDCRNLKGFSEMALIKVLVFVFFFEDIVQSSLYFEIPADISKFLKNAQADIVFIQNVLLVFEIKKVVRVVI